MKFGLSQNTIDKIIEVLKAVPSVEEAIIYGSRAKGNYREGSDIDLTLKGALSFADLLKIERELDDQMMPYKIDLSLFSNLENTDLVEHIQRVGKLLYKKPEMTENQV